MKDKSRSDTLAEIPPDLVDALQWVYEPSGLKGNRFLKDAESEEYGAFEFEMNGCRIKYRTAKITPTKTGQFVTLWKRIGTGPILPFDWEDPVDFFVVSVRIETHFGQFVFPKAVLHDKGIISKDGEGGKRAMRVYPPWDIAENKQAKKTQAWQLLYFFEIPKDRFADAERVRALFSKTEP